MMEEGDEPRWLRWIDWFYEIEVVRSPDGMTDLIGSLGDTRLDGWIPE